MLSLTQAFPDSETQALLDSTVTRTVADAGGEFVIERIQNVDNIGRAQATLTVNDDPCCVQQWP